MSIDQLRMFCNNQIIKHENLRLEIIGFFQLAVDEIEQGGNEDHECELAYSDIKELVND